MPEEHVIQIQLQDESYPICIKRGIYRELGARLKQLRAVDRAIIVNDVNVPVEHQAAAFASLAEVASSVGKVAMPASEETKSITGASDIFDAILSSPLDRNSILLAMGGGVIGDLVGFVAATVLRGVPFVQLPTTLLAMVDASVGGKTGINHSRGKNLIGAFHQPIAVFIDPAVLQSLPPRELRSGLAECIKHEVIRDENGFAALEKNISRALSLDLDYLSELIAHNVAIKAKVVQADPFERGERAHLNFGHTFGHAIENVLHYEYLHGECVALGMVAAADLAEKLGMLDALSRRRIAALIEQAQLPIRAKFDVGEVFDAMFYDKKAKAGKLRFVLPDRIGHVVIRDDVPDELVRDAIESINSR